MTRAAISGGALAGATRTPCCQRPRWRRMRSITSRSSIKATILWSLTKYAYALIGAVGSFIGISLNIKRIEKLEESKEIVETSV
jgi:hypothetical protein